MTSYGFYKHLKESKPELPRRLGDAWSADEDNKLLDLIQKNTIEEVAREHERTLGSIKSRLGLIAVKMYNSGTCLEDISKKTGLNMQTIGKWLQKDADNKRKKKDLANVPMADIMEVKLLLHEIRDVLRELVRNS